MRHTSYLALALALAAPCLARPDGVGGHHGGHHADHAAASAPSTGYAQPDAYSPPATGYEQPAGDYGAPSYDQPTDAYAQPTGYEQPTDAYAPATGYDTTGYDSYQDPAATYGDDTAAAAGGGFDLSTLLIPILIIAGLALLFPQNVVVAVCPPGGVAGVDPGCKRKKRSTGGE